MNRWGIPDGLEKKIRKRDKLCVYCHIKLKEHPRTIGVPRSKATWEHINNNDLRFSDQHCEVLRCLQH